MLMDHLKNLCDNKAFWIWNNCSPWGIYIINNLTWVTKYVINLTTPWRCEHLLDINGCPWSIFVQIILLLYEQEQLQVSTKQILSILKALDIIISSLVLHYRKKANWTKNTPLSLQSLECLPKVQLGPLTSEFYWYNSSPNPVPKSMPEALHEAKVGRTLFLSYNANHLKFRSKNQTWWPLTICIENHNA